MKRFIALTTGFSLLFFGLHIGLFLCQLGQKTESSRWVHEALLKKEEAAQSIKGERILIISGSNTLFSLSARRISKEVNIPTVNLGIHAGLRIEYILDRYLKLVREGDIILLPLEYSSYSYDGKTSETLADFASARDPQWVTGRAYTLLNNAMSFNIGELVSRNLKRFRPDQKSVGFYDASNIDSYGDWTNNDLSSRTERELAKVEGYSALRVAFSAESRSELEDFFLRAAELGATVLITFPTTIYFEAYEQEEFKRSIDEIRQFAKSNEIEVLGKPDDFFLPMNLFFNTNYHASSEGRAIVTDRLVELLKSYFEG